MLRSSRFFLTSVPESQGAFRYLFPELFFKIGFYLNPVDLYFWAITNKYFLQIISDEKYDSLWQYQWMTHFPLEAVEAEILTDTRMTEIDLANFVGLSYDFFKQANAKHYQQLYKIENLAKKNSKGETFISLIKKQPSLHTYFAHRIYKNNPDAKNDDLLSYAIQLNQADDECKKLISNLNTKDHEEFLLLAIAHNAINTVNLLLTMGFDPDGPFRNKSPQLMPLCMAANRCHYEIMGLLLPRIKLSAKCLDFALGVVSQHGNVEWVKRLVEHGADINAENPLFFAMQAGYAPIVGYLLEQGASSTSKYKNYSLLYTAASNNRLEAIEVFINHLKKKNQPLNLDELTDLGNTSLYVAAQNGYAQICQFLLEQGAQYHCNFFAGYSPLYVAAQNGHAEVIKVLLEEKNKADVFFIYPNGCTALCVAAQNNHYNVVELLCQYSPDIVNITRGGYTPLYVACQKGHKEVVRVLIHYQADVNLATKRKATPLYMAAQKGYADIVNLLISQGANVNMCIDKGYSPLHALCAEHSYDNAMPILASLIKAGADLTIRSLDGEIVSDVALSQEIKDILVVLEEMAVSGIPDEVYNQSNDFINRSRVINNITYFIQANQHNNLYNSSIKWEAEQCKQLLSGTFTPSGCAIVLYAFFNREHDHSTSENSFFQAHPFRKAFMQCILTALELASTSVAKKMLHAMLYDSLSETGCKYVTAFVDKIINIFNSPNEVEMHEFNKLILCMNLFETKIKQPAPLITTPTEEVKARKIFN